MNVTASVVMATYNSSKFIQESVSSILAQSFKDFEVIIVDDCSTDTTMSILQTFKDDRIRIFENKHNRGLAASLNEGIKKSKGKYIIRMDDDDICMSYRFERQIAYMEAHDDIGVCGSWVEFFGDENFIWKTSLAHGEIVSKQFFNTALAHPSVIIRKSVIEEKNLYYNESFRRAQDYDFFNRAGKVTRLSNIQESLLKYRIVHKNKKPKNHDLALSTLRQVRESIYEELNIIPSESFQEIHQRLGEGSFKKIDMKSCINFLKEVHTKNNIHQRFEPDTFNPILAVKWFKVVINNLPYSLLFLPPYPSIFKDLFKYLFNRDRKF